MKLFFSTEKLVQERIVMGLMGKRIVMKLVQDLLRRCIGSMIVGLGGGGMWIRF